jgi:hypothetical protein
MSVKFFAAAFVAVSSLVAANAYAEDSAPTLSNCLKLEKAVKSALDTNQQASNYETAKSELRAGREFCTNGLYQAGVQHYASALKLVGANGG